MTYSRLPSRLSCSICGPPTKSRPRNLPDFSQHAPEPQLAGELRLRRIADVVLPNVAVQPIGEVQIAVVQRHQQVGDQPRHRETASPWLSTDGTSITFSTCHRPSVLEPMPHRAATARRRRSRACCRDRDESGLPAGSCPAAPRSTFLSSFLLLPIPEAERVAVLAGFDVFRDRTRPRKVLARPIRC